MRKTCGILLYTMRVRSYSTGPFQHGEAEQEKAKATPTSGDRLLSQPVIAPVAEEADSASAGPQPALPAVLEEGEIREDDGSLDMDTTE